MSKWAAYSRRGSVKQLFPYAPLQDTDWHPSSATTTTITATRDTALPALIPPWTTVSWRIRALDLSGNVVATTSSTSATTAQLTGLVTGTTYQIQAQLRLSSGANAIEGDAWSTSQNYATL